jgi:hypothetical protein
MTDNEFKLNVAKHLLALEEKINVQNEALRALNDQQSEMIQTLKEWCNAMEAELGENDPYGLFDDENDGDTA